MDDHTPHNRFDPKLKFMMNSKSTAVTVNYITGACHCEYYTKNQTDLETLIKPLSAETALSQL